MARVIVTVTPSALSCRVSYPKSTQGAPGVTKTCALHLHTPLPPCCTKLRLCPWTLWSLSYLLVSASHDGKACAPPLCLSCAGFLIQEMPGSAPNCDDSSVCTAELAHPLPQLLQARGLCPWTLWPSLSPVGEAPVLDGKRVHCRTCTPRLGCRVSYPKCQGAPGVTADVCTAGTTASASAAQPGCAPGPWAFQVPVGGRQS
jgi:hypothetical protein